MNAYELADELDRIVKVSMPLHYITESADMLRQQADRIADLEKQLNLHKNAHHRAVEILQEKEKDYFNAGLDLHRQAARIAELEHMNKNWQLSETMAYNRIAELEKQLNTQKTYVLDGKQVFDTTSQIKELSDEENNLKWWISSFEHLKALGGGISDEMETKLKEMKAILKKASEK